MDASFLSREDDYPREEKIQKMLESAIAALKLQQYEDGKERLEEIMEEGTNNFTLLAKIYMYYGRVCRTLKDDVKALSFFENELNLYKLLSKYSEACETSRRVANQAIKMGNFSKAKRHAEELVDYTCSERDRGQFVRDARTLLVSVCLTGVEKDLEKNADEKQRLLAISTEQIAKVKELSEEYPNDAADVQILMLEAKSLALQNKIEEARSTYQKCISLCIKTKQFSEIHRAYSDMAVYADGNFLSLIINDLRSALFYASKYQNEREAVNCKLEVAEKLLISQNPHEAYLYSMESLESIRRLNLNWKLQHALLTVSRCLVALGNNSQAAYFIILGSVLTINKDGFNEFYKIIDDLMTNERGGAVEREDVKLIVDATVDTKTPNDVIAKFVVKLEHTTNLDTWKMIVNGIVEDQKKPAVQEQKENEEPVDFMDLICRMNNRMDDQRTELKPSAFLAPRPVSSASRKTTKSHRLLPGLRGNFAKIQGMKLDSSTMNKLFKRSKKSKTSLHSNSTQGDDTRSEDITVVSK